jgi:Holliday junction resolvasome RuvABC endonuclease subunit
MATFIAIDPAGSTGYALGKVTGSHCEIFEYGYIDIDTSSIYLGDHCLDLQSRIQELYIKYNFSDVAVEDYFFSKTFVSGVSVNTAYRTAIHMWARQNSLPYSILNITNWKTIAAGRSTPPKEFKLKYGKEASKKIYLLEALYLRHGIRLPNHSISESTGKPILFRYDIADALGQAIYHAYEKYNCKTFSCSVPVPPDVVFPRASKRNYSYPEPGINLIKEVLNGTKKEGRSRKSRTDSL